MIKLIYIISNINKALEFEWAATELKKLNYDIRFILLNPGHSELESYLNKNNIPCYGIKYRGKKDFLSALLKVVVLLRKIQPGIIHCHLFEATLIGLTAGRIAGIKNRVHTRHHSIWHHRYFPHAVKYDKLNNRLSTKIVAISKVVKDILTREGVNEEKIILIHHGVNHEDFKNTGVERIYNLKSKYNPGNRKPVIGVISRFTLWKGVQYIIPAFKKLLEIYPDALLILANAKGDYKEQIIKSLNELPENSYRLVEFENDLFAFYKLFDIFVHVPVDSESEAFGQIYVEAMAAGIPVICTRSGIGNEIAQDEINSIIVNYKDSSGIYNALVRLLKDPGLAKKISVNAVESVKGYTLSKKINQLDNLYKSLIL